MNTIKLFYSFILHGFLAYLWILFITNAFDFFVINQRSTWTGIIIGIGAILFLDLTARVFESFSKDKKSPIRIAGYVSFGIVVLGWLFFFR